MDSLTQSDMSSLKDPLAIIGGNALVTLPDLVIERRRVERTPYGQPSSPLLFGTLGQRPMIFIARHGVNLTIPPHEVNDMANIYAMHQTGVKAIIGISSAIGLSDALSVGDLMLPDQLIDIDHHRVLRFPSLNHEPYQPLSFSDPFDQAWRKQLYQYAPSDHPVHNGGTYILTHGLRSETKAEACFYKNMGGDVLGATGAQEAALARDIGIPYVLLLIIVRQAANVLPAQPQVRNFEAYASLISKWLSQL